MCARHFSVGRSALAKTNWISPHHLIHTLLYACPAHACMLVAAQCPSQHWLLNGFWIMLAFIYVTPLIRVCSYPLLAKKSFMRAYQEDLKIPFRRHFFPTDPIGTEPYMPSFQYFKKVWRTDDRLSHIRLRKHMQFALCDKCVRFYSDFMNLRSSPDQEHKADVQRKAQAHWQFVRQERDSYYMRRNGAISAPKSSFSAILDGADQSAFGCPHYWIKDKSSAAAYKLPVYVMGVLVHGETVAAFTYLNNIKHGSNVTIEALHLVLERYIAFWGILPPTMYIQLDNTSKQCKNHFIIGYLACLVAWGMTREVTLSYLPVGHTHEDIDQFFSHLATWLRCHDALDRDEILAAARAAYEGSGYRDPYVWGRNMDLAANISEWVRLYVAYIDYVSCYQQFRIFKRAGRVVMQARDCCSGLKPWGGIDPDEPYHKVSRHVLLPDTMITYAFVGICPMSVSQALTHRLSHTRTILLTLKYTVTHTHSFKHTLSQPHCLSNCLSLTREWCLSLWRSPSGVGYL